MKTLALIVGFIFLSMASAQGADAVIQNGKTVKFDYKLTVDGQVVDTSAGKQPLEYVQGQGMIIPGLEKEMAGMKVGEQKTVEVSAKEAYGEVNPEAFQEVPRESFPTDVDIKPGMVLPLKDNNGQPMPAVVSEIKDNAIVLNFNHPLAGKDLTFDIKVVEIK